MNCQAVGCPNDAMPIGIALDWDTIAIEVFLCRRHERDLGGLGLRIVPSKAKAPVTPYIYPRGA